MRKYKVMNTFDKWHFAIYVSVRYAISGEHYFWQQVSKTYLYRGCAEKALKKLEKK